MVYVWINVEEKLKMFSPVFVYPIKNWIFPSSRKCYLPSFSHESENNWEILALSNLAQGLEQRLAHTENFFKATLGYTKKVSKTITIQQIVQMIWQTALWRKNWKVIWTFLALLHQLY